MFKYYRLLLFKLSDIIQEVTFHMVAIIFLLIKSLESCIFKWQKQKSSKPLSSVKVVVRPSDVLTTCDNMLLETAPEPTAVSSANCSHVLLMLSALLSNKLLSQ